MENANSTARYKLPRRLASRKKLPAIEILAPALDVPLGYLLAGFNEEEINDSIYGPQVSSGKIKLEPLLRPEQGVSLRSFLHRLPLTESELLSLPLNRYYNQFAFGVIFQIEKLYPGLEMLLVNELPLVFWDQEDVALWTTNMKLNDEDATTFRSEFSKYRKHFRELAKARAKRYKVVVNCPTLMRFLDRKTERSRTAQLRDISDFLRLPTFDLVLHRPSTLSGRELIRSSVTEEAHEAEVLCRLQAIPASLDQTISIQIQQTPPDQTPVSYFVSPAPKSLGIIQKEIGRIDQAFAAALDQYRDDMGLGEKVPISDATFKEHTLVLLAKAAVAGW